MVGSTVFDRNDQEVGKVIDVCPNPTTLEPEWVIVQSGLLRKKHLLPVVATQTDHDRVQTTFAAELVKTAPGPEGPGAPDRNLAEQVMAHYGLTDDANTA